MKQGLFVAGYNRPLYFEQTVAALSLCEGVAEYDAHVFFDAPETAADAAAQQQMAQIATRCLGPQAQIHTWEEHGGCDKALMWARTRMFEKGYDRVLQVEDDYVVAPYAIRALEAMHAAGVARFGAGRVLSTLVAWCMEIVSWKQAHLAHVGRLSETDPSFLFTLIDAAVYNATVDVMDEYLMDFAKPSPRQRNGQAIRAWLGTQVLRRGQLPERWAAGQDGVWSAAMLAQGIESRAPLVNHGQYIGVHGVHSDAAVFASLGADKMQLDLFPDATSALARPTWVV